MFKEKILALLKAKAAGVANEVLTGVAVWLAATVTKEEDVAASVEGVLPLLTTMQSENDRRVTAFQQENTTLKDEITKLKGKTPPKKDGDPPTEDVPAWAQAMIDQNKTLLSQVEALKTENMGKVHQQTLIAKLKELEVPEKYYTPAIKGRTFKDDSEVTSLAGEISENYKTFAQDLADQGLGNSTRPVLSTKTDKDGLTEGVKNYLDTKFADPAKAEVAGLGGKKL
ncbi:MAG: hypothetical protein WC238_04685 [Parcubacteria group bacterium]|jgi:hypothetical protein